MRESSRRSRRTSYARSRPTLAMKRTTGRSLYSSSLKVVGAVSSQLRAGLQVALSIAATAATMPKTSLTCVARFCSRCTTSDVTVRLLSLCS